MNLDLSALLASFGPWGILAGIAIPIILNRLGVKIPLMKPTPGPTPGQAPVDPVPVPVPTPTTPDRPILNGLLALLALLKGIKAADLPPEEKALAGALLEELKK